MDLKVTTASNFNLYFNANMLIYAFSYASTVEEGFCVSSKKYLVCEEQLLKLFSLCSKCGGITDITTYEMDPC